jgi:hypothetical protein
MSSVDINLAKCYKAMLKRIASMFKAYGFEQRISDDRQYISFYRLKSPTIWFGVSLPSSDATVSISVPLPPDMYTYKRNYNVMQEADQLIEFFREHAKDNAMAEKQVYGAYV